MSRGWKVLIGAIFGAAAGVGLVFVFLFIDIFLLRTLFPPQGPSSGGDEVIFVVLAPPAMLIGIVAGAIAAWRWT